MARVSAADGLVALTGPLIRVAPAMLLEVMQLVSSFLSQYSVVRPLAHDLRCRSWCLNQQK